MESPDALLEFVNFPDGDYPLSAIKKFYAKYKIFHSLSIGEVGVYTRMYESRRVAFSFFSKDELSSLFPREEIRRWQEWAEYRPLFPGEVDFKGLESCWGLTVCEFRTFLNKCISNYIDLGFVNKFMPKENVQFELRPSHDIWKPTVAIFNEDDNNRYKTIDHYLVATQILPFLLRGDGEIFSRIRRCPVCKKYFIPKSLKKKFCSDKCRAAHHYAIEH
ncbi:hypothetical protein [Desulfolutivibrio sulfoxidireducens]|uniref:hypothetical protein n=1 Tax=Desulfolutivibrio sulfoxidireducens TaxID=2773299 RepID=UPI00159DFEBB|nr:hypothetical protein [Desulfolutivibrio sulfoxidireducens]QLA16099.1 hypothetical protein GD605_08135 [Desulfolutivibrio sulfoxidireducens]